MKNFFIDGYRASLRQVIENRIGLEVYTDRLSQISKNENYTRAAKKPHLNHKQPNEVLFDFEFTQLYRTLESKYYILSVG